MIVVVLLTVTRLKASLIVADFESLVPKRLYSFFRHELVVV